ncbi:MAG: hypothetical protein ABSF53_03805 [Terracidiphilus sp.]
MKSDHSLCALIVCLLAIPSLRAQEPAASVELPSRPFAIKQTWTIGGTGPWDYQTMDAKAGRLYIAHGHAVQVVDVAAGTVVGEIGGLGEAHCIALDDSGEFGYVSDGTGGKVVVFDRRSLKTVAEIENIPNARALVFEPQTRLLFAVRTDPVTAPAQPPPPRTTRHITLRPQPGPPPPPDPHAGSSITVIDTRTRAGLGQLLLSGRLGYALADSRGKIYVTVTDRDQIVSFDAATAATLLHQPSSQAASEPDPAPAELEKTSAVWNPIDWTDAHPTHVHLISPGRQCSEPRGLAVDSAHQRLFVACSSMKLDVLNAENGSQVATLSVGAGTDSIGYDPNRNLIYAANGGADGSLTVIHQGVTDSYAVIQTLPTRQRARTLAVNPDTGLVYLVTDLLGVKLSQSGGIGGLTTDPVEGSFEVLVVGN